MSIKKDRTTFFPFFRKESRKVIGESKKKKKEKTNETLKYWISLICTGLSNFRYRISLSPSPPTRLQIRDSHHPLAENAKRTATNACLSRENNPLSGVEIEREPRDERRAIVTSHTLLEYASNGPPKAWNNIAIIILPATSRTRYAITGATNVWNDEWKF